MFKPIKEENNVQADWRKPAEVVIPGAKVFHMVSFHILSILSPLHASCTWQTLFSSSNTFPTWNSLVNRSSVVQPLWMREAVCSILFSCAGDDRGAGGSRWGGTGGGGGSGRGDWRAQWNFAVFPCPARVLVAPWVIVIRRVPVICFWNKPSKMFWRHLQ